MNLIGVQPMHIHYTGWRQESNYVPMNFDHLRPIGAPSDQSLSFDSAHSVNAAAQSAQAQAQAQSGLGLGLGLGDPFAAPASLPSINHYEIQVDSVDRQT